MGLVHTIPLYEVIISVGPRLSLDRGLTPLSSYADEVVVFSWGSRKKDLSHRQYILGTYSWETSGLSYSERLARLQKRDLEIIILRLTTHALYKVQRLSWQTGKKELPGGKEPKDLAFDAIQMVWTGQRAWDPDKQTDLLKHLKSIVDSLVSHLVESAEHTKRERPKEGIEEETFDPPDDQTPSPLDEVIASNAFRKLRDQAKEDEDLELVLYCIEEGISRPTDISDTLRIPVDRVYKAKKKLGVILRRIQEEDNG